MKNIQGCFIPYTIIQTTQSMSENLGVVSILQKLSCVWMLNETLLCLIYYTVHKIIIIYASRVNVDSVG